MYPVAVVGNGPVGSTTALLLARRGVGSVLLDARPGREPVGSRSICQQRDVLDIWDSVGAGRRIAAEGVTWSRARTFYRDRELFSRGFTDPGRSSFPPFVNLSQSRTEQILDDCVAAAPLVEVRWDAEVTDIANFADRVELECATPTGRQRVVAAYAVLCAGGRADRLRERLGVSFPGRSYPDRFLICDVQTDLPGWERERRFYFDPAWNPGRQVLIHPCPDSTYRIDWQVPADFDVEADAATGRLDARIRQVVGDRDYSLVWRSVYRFSARCADRFRVGRVLLAGDCAHLVAPFGARGLNSGVADAENAAWKLAYVLAGWAPESLLASYPAERRAAAAENLEVTNATMSFLVPQTPAERERRRAALEAARDDPAAIARVDSGRLAEPFWYDESPLTTPDPSRPFAGRPPAGQPPPPGPGVLVPDLPVEVGGRAGRLRALARLGPLGLTGTSADAGRVAAAIQPVTAAPVRVLALDQVDAEGRIRDALGYRRGEVWLLRPDGHVAAVLGRPDPAAAVSAVRRLLGSAVPPTPDDGAGEPGR